MKTFFELRKQFLNEHHEKYCAFTKLLVALSVAFITLLASSPQSTTPPSWLLNGSLVFQLASLFFGLIVQHQIMHDPLKHLDQAEKLQALAQENEEEMDPIEIRRTPSLLERICYKLQVICFIVSFTLIASHFVSAQGSIPQHHHESTSDRSTACLTNPDPRLS